MNVLLVNPPSFFRMKILNEVTMPDMPMGLAYIAAVLEQSGHFVRIADLNMVSKKEEIKKKFLEVRYDVVGFTATTSTILYAYKAIRVIKKMMPWVITILGGWHASGSKQWTMNECPELDILVKGEGEETLKEIVISLQNKILNLSQIKGILYRDSNGVCIENEDRPLIKDLDSLPFPARHLLPMNEYQKVKWTIFQWVNANNLKISNLVTSRGCTGRCIFCADHTIYKYQCRFRSPENVVAEIKEVVEKYNIRVFYFQDAHFTQSPVRAQRICELIIKEKIKIVWVCVSRVDTVSKELIQLMKRAGCVLIGFGIETGSPRMLRFMNKHVTYKQMQNALKWTRDAKIFSYNFIISGIPGETKRDLFLTRQLLLQLKSDFVSHTIAVPYPGTKLREIALLHNKIKDDRWEVYNHPYGKVLNYLGSDEVFKLQGKVLRDYYLSPFFIKNVLKNLRSIHQLLFYFKILRVYLLGKMAYHWELMGNLFQDFTQLAHK